MSAEARSSRHSLNTSLCGRRWQHQNSFNDTLTALFQHLRHHVPWHLSYLYVNIREGISQPFSLRQHLQYSSPASPASARLFASLVRTLRQTLQVSLSASSSLVPASSRLFTSIFKTLDQHLQDSLKKSPRLFTSVSKTLCQHLQVPLPSSSNPVASIFQPRAGISKSSGSNFEYVRQHLLWHASESYDSIVKRISSVFKTLPSASLMAALNSRSQCLQRYHVERHLHSFFPTASMASLQLLRNRAMQRLGRDHTSSSLCSRSISDVAARPSRPSHARRLIRVSS